jgi:hypothetical protein
MPLDVVIASPIVQHPPLPDHKRPKTGSQLYLPLYFKRPKHHMILLLMLLEIFLDMHQYSLQIVGHVFWEAGVLVDGVGDE